MFAGSKFANYEQKAEGLKSILFAKYVFSLLRDTKQIYFTCLVTSPPNLFAKLKVQGGPLGHICLRTDGAGRVLDDLASVPKGTVQHRHAGIILVQESGPPFRYEKQANSPHLPPPPPKKNPFRINGASTAGLEEEAAFILAPYKKR